MKYMEIGHSGIRASVITLGAWSMGGGDWWKSSTDEESIRTVHRALDAGINLIDTAPVYGLGHSEEVIGRAIRGRRDKVVLSTKCTFSWGNEEGRYAFTKDGQKIYKNFTAPAIKRDVENSLKRLGTDYIDILYTHNPSRPPDTTPVEETVGALTELKKEGKIRAIGSSNIVPKNFEEYTDAGCEIDIIQRKYSLLDRSAEKDLLPICRRHGITFHAYSPIERGLLTGKIAENYTFGSEDARAGQPWWEPERLPLAVRFVNGLKDICLKYGCTQTELAIAFLRGQGPFINVICGAHKPEQIDADIPAVEIVLAEEDLAEIRRRVELLETRVQA